MNRRHLTLQMFDRLEELQSAVAPSHLGRKPRQGDSVGRPGGQESGTPFCVKLAWILDYTRQHPEDYPRVGATWDREGETVFVHTKLLSCFMDVRPSVVNVSMRDHGFKIVASGKSGIPELAHLPNCGEWKGRRNPLMTARTTIEEVRGMETKMTRPEVIPMGCPAFVPH